MIALRIEDIRQFTAKLFVGETFDHFLIKEAEIVTFNVFTIDGHIRQGYYSEEELEENQMEELSSWKMIRPYCFSLIKGKNLPGSFQIVLQMPPQAVDKFVTGHQMPLKADQVNGLYLNIRYEEGKLFCVTGTSVSIFTLDKTLDMEWDQAVRSFLKKNEIIFQEE